MPETIPPDIFGEGEIITFFPTVEFLYAQAEYIWQQTEPYYIKVSSYQKGKLLGTSPYLYDAVVDDIKQKSLSKYYKFSSDNIEISYNESNVKLDIILPEKTNIKIKKPATVDSVYISVGTLPILGGNIHYSLGDDLKLSPFKNNFTTINSDFFNTTVNGYFLGIAKDVEIVKHENGTNTILYNSSQDFISKCLNNFDNSQSSATFCELSPSFSIGTIASRPCVVIDYGTSPVNFISSETDLIYDCLFLFKSSTPDYSDAFVCYASPLDSNFYIFGSSESKAIFDENLEGKNLEINDIKVKTELSWEVFII